MNLTLHHFRKEARYLLPRWWLWIALLIIELCLDLEWLVPLSVHGASWPAFACLVTWTAGLLITVQTSPEDGADQAFVCTRPLPAWSYWLARVLVFLILIMLPLVLQEVVYLALSDRPWEAVLTGAGVRAVRVVSVLGWAAAMGSLWRGWPLVVSMVLSVVVVSYSQSFFSGASGGFDSIIFMWHIGITGAAMAMLAVLVMLKRQRDWTLHSIIVGQVVGCIAIAWLAARWLAAGWLNIATDQPRADALAKQAQLSFSTHDLTFGGHGFGMRQLDAKPLPPWCDYWAQAKNASARTDHHELPVKLPRIPGHEGLAELFNCFPSTLSSKARALTSHLPPDTISALLEPQNYTPGDKYVDLPSLADPLPAPDVPLQITAEYAVHWIDWSPLLELPLQLGAVASTADERWSILDLHFGMDREGHASPAAVTIDCRGESAAGFTSTVGASAAFILYSPDRGMVWIHDEGEWMPDMRSCVSSWTKHVRSITWQGVLAHADDTPAALDRSKLRLIVIRPQHLGATRWTWQSPSIRLAELKRPPPQFGYSTNEHLHRGTEQAAFDTRMASLAKLVPHASRQDVLRYLWEVLSAARGEEFSEQNPPDRLRALLEEVAQQHLDAMLAMPDSMASPWANLLREVLDPLIQDQHKTTLLKQLAGQQWLAPIVAQRGWMTEAVQALSPLLQSTKPLNVHMRKLLIKSDDPAVHRRLLDNFRRHPNEGYEVIDALVKRPELHSDLKAVAEELWRNFEPVLGIKQDNRLRLAIQMGNANALALALRLAAISDERAGSVHRLVFDLPRLLGLPQPLPNARPADLAGQYRKLKATDFTYRTDKLLWEKKPNVTP